MPQRAQGNPRDRYRPSRSHQRRSSSHRYSSHSPSRNRQSHHWSNTHSPSSTCKSPHHRHKRSPTPSHQVSPITAFNTQSIQEGKLFKDVASDGDMSFHTELQMITKHGSKPIPGKLDPATDVNTIPLSRYRKLFPEHFMEAGNIKQKALYPTKHILDSSQQHPKTFPRISCIADIHHKTHPEVLQVRFYVFKDTTCPTILLSCATSERLGIVKFQVPNKPHQQA